MPFLNLCTSFPFFILFFNAIFNPFSWCSQQDGQSDQEGEVRAEGSKSEQLSASWVYKGNFRKHRNWWTAWEGNCLCGWWCHISTKDDCSGKLFSDLTVSLRWSTLRQGLQYFMFAVYPGVHQLFFLCNVPYMCSVYSKSAGSVCEQVHYNKWCKN